jgi:tetratricopeptide (TPR) repeat protein
MSEDPSPNLSDDPINLVIAAASEAGTEEMLDQVRLRALEIVTRLEEDDAEDDPFAECSPEALNRVVEALAEGLGYGQEENGHGGSSALFLEAEEHDKRLGTAIAELLEDAFGPAAKQLEEFGDEAELEQPAWRNLLADPDAQAMLDASHGRLEWLVRRGVTPRALLLATNILGLAAQRARQRRILRSDRGLLITAEGLTDGSEIVATSELVERISEASGVPRQTAGWIYSLVRHLLSEAPGIIWDHRAEIRNEDLVILHSPGSGDGPIAERWAHLPLKITHPIAAAAAEKQTAFEAVSSTQVGLKVKIAQWLASLPERIPASAPIIDGDSRVSDVHRVPTRQIAWRRQRFVHAVTRMAVPTAGVAVVLLVVWAFFRGRQPPVQLIVPVSRAAIQLGKDWLGTAGPLPRYGEFALESIRHGSDYGPVLLASFKPSENAGLKHVRFQLEGDSWHVRSEVMEILSSRLPEEAARFWIAAREDRKRGRKAVISSEDLATIDARRVEAQTLYVEACSAYYRFDTARARAGFRRAVAADRSNPFAYLALAEASQVLGAKMEAVQASAQAAVLARALPRDQSLLVRARWRATENDWSRAVGLYERLHQLEPVNLGYVLGYVETLIRIGQSAAALKKIDEAMSSIKNAKDDPRLALAEGAAANAIGAWRRQREAARRATVDADELGADLLVARGFLFEGEADLVLDDVQDSALQSFAVAEPLFRRYGDQLGVADVLSWRATIAWTKEGDVEAARNYLQTALRLYERKGALRGAAHIKVLLGDMLLKGGDPRPREAMRLYVEALASSREFGNDAGVVEALTGLGVLEWQETHDLAKAEAQLVDAAATAERIGDREGQASALASLGGVYAERQEWDGAEKRLREAQSLWESTGNASGIASADRMLGDLYLDMHRVDLAAEHLKRALVLQEKRREAAEVKRTRDSLARLERERSEAAKTGV